MTMLSKNIRLSEHFNSTSLITRQAARDIFEIISSSAETEIVLDFSNIQNATRSFFDEFNAFKKKIHLLGKTIEIVNLNSNLTQLYNLVTKQSETNGINYTSTANARFITI